MLFKLIALKGGLFRSKANGYNGYLLASCHLGIRSALALYSELFESKNHEIFSKIFSLDSARYTICIA